ncbi:NAD(P)-dependent dehydrogenase (short-subunit alcohol dehydrogenase family) [Rhodococcus erythropolis]|uniref:SDR family NAD(P)-dependent oxidoreductase n=1 Tax=Rhodococcus erythropolis TaxID=1833 RepID=UPI00216898EC|nr:SDR family NAD(P)-dependent oxidoreductase [Rhodococcus erythropolis]MCS4255732.1 NAD(P)-dependent dehydrogenase (short-subunit alcohol dehydrogenase family) [Rhodococcus erythropolis]MCW2425246.1 NAD(P)-dependent dehydrogenase (short-subunit alcohol dehydrogenase family) [Rhodococcus erythropolis]
MKDLRGRVAVVTGAASGIGLALATRFADEGMKVVLADVEPDALERASNELARGGADVIAVPTDVRDIDAVQALADRAIDAFGAVHLVCNNAGVETGGSFLEIPYRAWQWVMDVNFYGVLNGCRVFLPLLETQDEGHIVNTASVAAFASGTSTMTPYCASKSAILGMSECLAIELDSAGSSVGVSLLAPGPVKTKMTDAERNLPPGVPPASEPHRVALMEELKAKADAVGLEPSAVAGMVVDAVRDQQFYILPHAEMAFAGVQRRLRWMTTGELPGVRTAGT